MRANDRAGDAIHGMLPPVGESELADQIREGIGAAPMDEVQFVTPQFTRPVGEPDPCSCSREPAWWEGLRHLDETALREMGLGVWARKNGKALMLFPGEWYAYIPAGYEVVDINAFEDEDREPELFVPGETDDDIRFGCLAFGIVVKAEGKDDVEEDH